MFHLVKILPTKVYKQSIKIVENVYSKPVITNVEKQLKF